MPGTWDAAWLAGGQPAPDSKATFAPVLICCAEQRLDGLRRAASFQRCWTGSCLPMHPAQLQRNRALALRRPNPAFPAPQQAGSVHSCRLATTRRAHPRLLCMLWQHPAAGQGAALPHVQLRLRPSWMCQPSQHQQHLQLLPGQQPRSSCLRTAAPELCHQQRRRSAGTWLLPLWTRLWVLRRQMTVQQHQQQQLEQRLLPLMWHAMADSSGPQALHQPPLQLPPRHVLCHRRHGRQPCPACQSAAHRWRQPC